MIEPAKPQHELSWNASDSAAGATGSRADTDKAESAQREASQVGGYDLAEPEQPSAPPLPDMPPRPECETAQESTFEAAAEQTESPSVTAFPDTPPNVSEIWTRWSDWKGPLIWAAGGVVLATLILFGGPYVAMILFLAAATYGAYRIIISLEVPVRVTPEQAIKEFFAAASHRLPNFDRMYALLTSDAKRCDAFRDRGEFRKYWTDRIAQFCRSPIWLLPLEFQVEGFTCRYNEDKSMALVRYTVKVTPRTQTSVSTPIAEFNVRNLVVKAADSQWYVNDGTLPD